MARAGLTLDEILSAPRLKPLDVPAFGARVLNFQGHQHSVSGWARLLDCDFQTLLQRLHRGWSAERVLGTPIGKYRKRRGR